MGAASEEGGEHGLEHLMCVLNILGTVPHESLGEGEGGGMRGVEREGKCIEAVNEVLSGLHGIGITNWPTLKSLHIPRHNEMTEATGPQTHT